MPEAYYNEIDPFAAQWLRNLIEAGHIAAGDVDERDIRDVRPCDLAGYAQCHFFAGIGGWSLALRLAGWSDDRPVWTGSCPCQPFSAAGKRNGFADERHLWPVWHHLIHECKPFVIFGEQVEAGIRQGWLDLVFADLEAESYACGAAVLPACGVGAPHIRNRLWFVANASSRRARRHAGDAQRAPTESPRSRHQHRIEIPGQPIALRSARESEAGPGTSVDATGAWSDCDWLPCTDGKARPVEPGTFPLAHGIPGRVGHLRAYGNAIVPQVAAEFVRAYA